MDVLFLLTNPAESPGERYRILQYLPRLEALGIRPQVDTLLSRDHYRRLQTSGSRLSVGFGIARAAARRVIRLKRSRGFDLAVLYRQPVALWPGSVERLLESQRVPFLFDFDDAIFLPPPAPLSRLSNYLRPPHRVETLVRNAGLTTAGNRYLAEFARLHSDRVELLPTCVDTDVYKPGSRPRRPRVVIGWIGSRSTAPYLRELDAVWGRLDRRSHVLRVVGGSYHHPSTDMDTRPWSLQTEAADVADFDIGVMPLPDDPWTQGKCGLKILQYMAAGVATVASPVGVNKEIIKDGVNGFLASTTDEWVEKLRLLAQDEDLRHALGRAGRTTVMESYSLARWAPRFVEMMTKAVP